MTRPLAVFANCHEAGYPKTHHCHSIRPGDLFSSNMRVQHDKKAVEREKSHPSRFKTFSHQHYVIALESLDRCHVNEIDDIGIILFRVFPESDRNYTVT